MHERHLLLKLGNGAADGISTPLRLDRVHMLRSVSIAIAGHGMLLEREVKQQDTPNLDILLLSFFQLCGTSPHPRDSRIKCPINPRPPTFVPIIIIRCTAVKLFLDSGEEKLGRQAGRAAQQRERAAGHRGETSGTVVRHENRGTYWVWCHVKLVSHHSLKRFNLKLSRVDVSVVGGDVHVFL